MKSKVMCNICGKYKTECVCVKVEEKPKRKRTTKK